MKIKNLRIKMAAIDAEIEDLLAKETTTKEDLAAITAKTAEMDEITSELTILEAARTARGKAAVGAGSEAGSGAGTGEHKTYAQPKVVKSAMDKIGIFGAAMCKAAIAKGSAFDLLDQDGYGDLAKEFSASTKTAPVAAGSGTGSYAVPTPLQAEVIELLYPQVTFLQGGPRVMPLPNGNFNQAGGATGATAGYVGEAAAVGASAPTFRKLSMSAKKLAAIVPVTRELQRFALPQAQSFVQQDLQMAMGVTFDRTAWLGVGSATAPTGILTAPGFTVADSSGTATPTVAQIDQNLNKLLLAFATGNITIDNKWIWWMAPRSFLYMQSLRTANGEFAYPSLQGKEPTLKGYPVLKSTICPINLGAGTNQSLIALVDFNHVYYGDAYGLELSVSVDGAVDFGSGLVSLFQNDLVAFKAEMSHDFTTRVTAATSTLTGVLWQ